MDGTPLTTGNVATFCHVTHRTVLKWIEEGKLETYRTPGGHYRIRASDFVRFLRQFNMPVPSGLNGAPSKKKILVVDDDRNMAASIRRMLRQNGTYEVELAFDGFDAGQKFSAFAPDLILLDIRMPGMDGYEVARRIKQASGGAHVRIIFMSAFFEEEGKEKMHTMGIDGFIDKPFSENTLLAAIRRMD